MPDCVRKIIAASGTKYGYSVLQPTINGIYQDKQNGPVGNDQVTIAGLNVRYGNRYNNYSHDNGDNTNGIMDVGVTSVSTTTIRIDTSATKCHQGMQIIAATGNPGLVYIGNSGAHAGSGFPLAPGASIFVPIDDTSKVWASGATGTNTLNFIAI